MRELDTIFFEYILSLSGAIVFSTYTVLTVGTTGWMILGVSVLFLSLIYINARHRAVVNGAKSEGRARTRAIAIMLVLILLLVAGTVSGMTWVLTKWPIDITDPVADDGADGDETINATLIVNATWEDVNASSTPLDAPILRITIEAVNTTSDTTIGFGNLEPSLHNGSRLIANLSSIEVDTNNNTLIDPGEAIRIELGQYSLDALDEEERAAYRIVIFCRPDENDPDTIGQGCTTGSELASVPLPPLNGTGA